MPKQSKRGPALLLAAGGVLLILLNLLYFAECDELYFSAWRFASVSDRLLSRPIQSGSYVIGLMHNGRLLGTVGIYHLIIVLRIGGSGNAHRQKNANR